MATAQYSPPPPNHFNIVEHSNNHHKQHKSKHEEQEEVQQEVFEYSHHEDEPPQPSGGSSRTSLSSSPSHEFSFTVCSLHTSLTTAEKNNVTRESLTNSTTSSASAATAIDLSPADEIFYHGHLLPLHLLSGGHLSISPRSSTNSLDGFTLPITSLSNPSNSDDYSSLDQNAQEMAMDNRDKPKSRSFSLFRNATTTSKSRKQTQNQETAENRSKPHHDDQKNLNKVKFDLSNAIKQYAKLVRPLLTFKQGNSISNNNKRESGIQMKGKTFSYSGNISHERSNKQGVDEVLRGRFSAPASMRTSPTNTGMFLEASKSNNGSSSSSDSTMEELQAAIQAAIAHCKNSSVVAAAIQDKV